MNESVNYRKKLAKHRFQHLILEMHLEGKSISEIAKNINFRLVRTSLKVTLSDSTIRNIIKDLKIKRGMK